MKKIIIGILCITISLSSCKKSTVDAPFTKCLEQVVNLTNGGVYHITYYELQDEGKDYLIHYATFGADSTINYIKSTTIYPFELVSIRPYFKCYKSFIP